MPRTQSDDDRAGGIGADPVRNPFERRIDRVERVATAVLVLLFAATVPLSIHLAGELHDLGKAAIVEAERTSYQAKARLLGPPESTGSPGGTRAPRYLAPAEWLDPSGQVTVGDVPVRPSSRTGSTVTLWFDRNDDEVVDTPIEDEIPIAAAVAAAIAIMLASAGTFGGLLIAVRQRANDVRMREWEVEWARVEPVWTRRPGQRPDQRPDQRRDQRADGEE